MNKEKFACEAMKKLEKQLGKNKQRKFFWYFKKFLKSDLTALWWLMVKLNFSFNERYNSAHETNRSILRELAQATTAHPLRTPVKDVFPFATWLGSISTFRVRVGSFNYRCTRTSVRCKAGGWQSTINWTDCRSPVQLALRNPVSKI